MTLPVQDETQPEEMTVEQLRKYVSSAKANNIDPETIYDTVRDQPVFQRYKSLATQNGVPDKQQRYFIGNEVGLDTRKKPTMIQSALERFNPLVPAIGSALGVKELEETKALPGGFLAGALAAPRSLIDLPASLARESIEFHHPGTQQPSSAINTRFGEFNPEQAYTPPGVENGEASPYRDVPEIGDIGPLIRAILPSGEQTTEALVAERSMPETEAGQALFRTAQFAGGGAAGGLNTAALGGVLGALDYGLEKGGYSPEGRLAIESLVTLRPNPAEFKQWKTGTLKRARRQSIDSSTDLAAKIFVRDPENINFQALSDLKSAGFDLGDVPVQAYTKGGLPNWIEGSQENALWGQKRYNQLIGQFTEEMTKKADAVLDGIPIQEINDAVTHESLGAPKFDNYVKNTLDELAPNLDIDRKTIGKLGTDSIEHLDTSLKDKADSFYNEVKFNDTDFIEPNSNAYRSLKGVIQRTKRQIEGEGFIGADREAGLRVISQLENLFEEAQVGGSEILGPNGEPFEPISAEPLIKYEDLRKNLQALNSKLSYDKPGVINLLEPISKEIRSIFRSEAINNPKVIPFLQAQETFGQRANLLKDPLIRKLYNMTDEQFYNAMKKPSNLEAFREFSNASGDVAAYDQLRGGLLAKELQPAFEANTPGEMASKLTDSLIERIRDIQQFYPEYPELANGLKKAREGAREFNSTEATQKGMIRQEAIDYQLTGETPSKILAKMDTPKGINLVRDALGGTKQGQSLYNSLARKKVEQTIYGKTKKTEIKLSDLADVFKDQQADTVLQNLLPSKNYNELKILSRIAESFEQGKKVSPYMKKRFEQMVLTSAGVATYISGGLLGGGAGVGILSVSALTKAAMTKNFRKAIANRAEGLRKP